MAMTDEEVNTLLALIDLDDDDLLDVGLDDDLPATPSKSSPRPTPAPTVSRTEPRPARTPPAPPKLGWGEDGKFRATTAQLRDANWCAKHNADRAKALSERSFVLID
jgi:hypothetical protein